MLPVHGGENARKPFPLSSNEALEASTTVKQRSIEVEDHRLYISQHQVYALIRDLTARPKSLLPEMRASMLKANLWGCARARVANESDETRECDRAQRSS